MVPTTPLSDDPIQQRRHESINDLPVHRLTDPQIFYPVSESRRFTRVDAGRVFSGAPRLPNRHVNALAKDPAAAVGAVTQRPAHIERVGKPDDESQVLQPADSRIPHPYLIAHERDRIARPDERGPNVKRFAERLMREEEADKERKDIKARKIAKSTSRVQPRASRFEFRVSDVVVSKNSTGDTGRGAKAPGSRYGVPSYERKKGQVKIPTEVKV